MTGNKTLAMVMGLSLMSMHCAEETTTPQGITAPASSGQLRDFAGAYRGESGGVVADALTETQGPLCIGLKPPENAYLPLPEPVNADADEEDRDSVADSGIGDGLSGDDSSLEDDATADGWSSESPIERVDAESIPPSDEPTGEGDAESQMWFSSLDGESRDGEDGDAEEAAEADTDEGPSFPLLPPVQEPEEPEEYDCTPTPVTCPGSTAPAFALFDFQPQSCGFQATYGLDLYENHVTLVALLAAW